MRISDWSSDVCSSDLGDPDSPASDRRSTPVDSGPRCRYWWTPPRVRGRTRRYRDAQDRSEAPRTVPLRHISSQRTALGAKARRSEEHTSELTSLMRISYAVFCSQKKINHITIITKHTTTV